MNWRRERPQTKRLEIPQGILVSFVIGDRGCILKSIKRETGAHVWVDIPTRTVNITGVELAIQRATVLLCSHFQTFVHKSNLFAMRKKYKTERLVIPDEVSVAWVIGMGGCNLKSITRQTSARVWVDNDTRTVTITGIQRSIDRASVLMHEHFQSFKPLTIYSLSNEANKSEHLKIPEEVVVAWLIGDNGIHLKSIKHETGAHVYVNAVMRTVIITGLQAAIERATVLLRALIQTLVPSSAAPTSETDNRTEYVAIPEDVPVGHLVGKKGRNFKYIKIETKAQLWVEAGTVRIFGSQYSVERARNILRKQFAAHEEGKAMPYAHTEGGFVLGQALSECKEIVFVERQRKTSTCRHFNEPGFEIIPVPVESSSTSLDGAAAANANPVSPGNVGGTAGIVGELEGTGFVKHSALGVPNEEKLTEKTDDRPMMVWSELPLAIEAHAAALLSGIGDHSGTLKFNFGKQIFYGPNVPAAGTPVKLTDLCDTFRVHRVEGYRSYYVNSLPENEAKGLGAILRNSFDFEAHPRQYKVVEHMIDQRNNVGHAVFFDMPDGLNGKLELESCEAAATTHGFLPIVCGGREHDLLDVRFKIHGFTSSDSHQQNPEVIKFAKDAQFVKGKLVFDSNKYITDVTRVKTVTPYTGKVAGRDVTVNVMHVSMTEDCTSFSHWEVTGVVDVPPLLSADELAELVEFTMTVAAELPAQMVSST